MTTPKLTIYCQLLYSYSPMETQKIQIRQADDWHLHLRDDAALATTVAHAAKQFARAIIMPNLTPPVTTAKLADSYRQRILQHVPSGCDFKPLMTLYLTDQCTRETVKQAQANPHIVAFKLYPAGATTNSDAGVRDLEQLYPMFEQLCDSDLLLLIHGEVTDKSVDIFDREAVFIDRSLSKIREKFPELRIVLEHITTAYAVDYIRAHQGNTAATITAHHLRLNRNDLLVGGIKPHFYCLPVLKRNSDQVALLNAATSGEACFFFGSDSAPHAQAYKESACGCAGVYTAHAALEFLADVFDAAGCLDKLEDFCSSFGADFYQLPRNTKRISLIKKAWQVPITYPFGQETLVPLGAGDTLPWQLCHD